MIDYVQQSMTIGRPLNLTSIKSRPEFYRSKIIWQKLREFKKR